MRRDIAKVINEKGKSSPRMDTVKTGKKLDLKNLRQEDQESVSRAPESRRRQYGYDSKRHDANFRPVDRFLHKSLGQPWDKIQSEILAQPMDARTRKSIKDHLQYKVCITTRLVGKLVKKPNHWFNSRYGNNTEELWIPVSDEFYVHPVTGCLCWADTYVAKETEEQRRNRMAKRITVLQPNPNVRYTKDRDNIWRKETFSVAKHDMTYVKIDPLSGFEKVVQVKAGETYSHGFYTMYKKPDRDLIEDLLKTEIHWILKTGKRRYSS